MSRSEHVSTDRVNALRARRRAAGRVLLNADIPAELMHRLDEIKVKRGSGSRSPLIEEALRMLIEKETRA
nr:ribbon-helix-helix protein, CopG family [Neorhizobium alkalisoli]